MEQRCRADLAAEMRKFQAQEALGRWGPMLQGSADDSGAMKATAVLMVVATTRAKMMAMILVVRAAQLILIIIVIMSVLMVMMVMMTMMAG